MWERRRGRRRRLELGGRKDEERAPEEEKEKSLLNKFLVCVPLAPRKVLVYDDSFTINSGTLGMADDPQLICEILPFHAVNAKISNVSKFFNYLNFLILLEADTSVYSCVYLYDCKGM